jgi:type I restriction enzyme M protein
MRSSPTSLEFFLRLWAEVDISRRDRLKDTGRPSFLGMVALVLYLRWLDARFANNASALDSRQVSEVMWSKWSEYRGAELVRFLTTTGPNHLAAQGGVREDLHTAIKIVVSTRSADFDPAYCEFVVKWVGQLDLTTENGLAGARQLMDEAGWWATGDNRYFSAHTTPAAVIDLMTEIADPKLGDRVYDPCFGVGGLLVSCSRYIRDKTMSGNVGPSAAQHGSVLAGYEINALSFLIGAVRLLLEVNEDVDLHHGDALELPSDRLFKAQGFDVILACPPWGAATQRSRRERFVVPSSDYTNLFLQHIANNLCPGGRAVVAVPEGTLFRAGPTRSVRKLLLENYQVEGVISLPAGTFVPATNVKGNLVVIRRTPPVNSLRFCVVHALEGTGQRSLLGAESPASIAMRFRSEEQAAESWDVRIESIAERNYELVAKRTGEERLAELLTEVEGACKTASIKELGQIAEVFQGTHYDRQDLLESRSAVPNAIGVVRIADLRNGTVESPFLFVVTEHESHRLLKAGDIVISMSGTIGHTAVVPSTELPLVASRGIGVIRLSEGLMPEFVAALLESEAYAAWLEGHANGSTVQHLTVRALKRVPVVIPTEALQAHVAAACSSRKADALSQLVGAATGKAAEPVQEWLATSEPVRQLHLYKADGVTAKVAELLDELANSVTPVRDRLVHSVARDSDARLGAWTVQLSVLLQSLRGLTRIPEGASLLSILDNSRVSLAKCSELLGSDSAGAHAAAVSLTRRLDDALAAIRERLLNAVNVVATVEPAVISVGRAADVIIKARNLSPLPLRGLVFRTYPSGFGSSACFFMESGDDHVVSLNIPSQTEEGFLEFELLWRGTRLDGKGVDGRTAMRIEVVNEKSGGFDAIDHDLGPSPYIVGNPIDREEMFFGRSEHLDRIVRQLGSKGKANVILLEGNRRTGKTSILTRLADPSTLPGWIAVNCSFQGGEGAEGRVGLPTNEVYRLLAKQIGWQVYDMGVETWLPGIAGPDSSRRFKPQFAAAVRAAFASSNPFEIFELYLHEVFSALGDRRLLLMLDEFDKLQEGIVAGVTSPQVPENLRYLIHTYPKLSAILSGGRQLKGMREGYWSTLFGFGHRIDVSSLPLDAARLLVTTPVLNRLVYVDEARDYLIDLCSCHPFLVQSLCNHVFEAAARDSMRTITVPYVEAAAATLIRDNEHFHTLWEYAGTERRRYILALIERHPNDADPISFDAIASRLEDAGIRLTRRERLGDDIDWVCDLELVKREAGPSSAYYQLTVPLFGKWIRARIDFDDLRRRAVAESRGDL